MPDQTITVAQLVRMAADELMLTDSANALEDEDVEKITARVYGFLNELSARRIIDVGNTDAIPIEYGGPLAELLANHVSRIFGKPQMPDATRMATEGRLKLMVSGQPTYEIQKTDYF